MSYQYSKWFQNVDYNGKTLTPEERKDFVRKLDKEVSFLSSQIPNLVQEIHRIKLLKDDYHNICLVVNSVFLFVIVTLCDCMVASKLYISSDVDYDKRFMRGKLKVILNEGFKKLYGYVEKNKKTSEWSRLLNCMHFFPEDINLQYQELTALLEKQSKISTWWRNERNYETHIEAEKLCKSRMEIINDSKEMIETLQLYNALFAVNQFLSNAHSYILNYSIDLYQKLLINSSQQLI